MNKIRDTDSSLIDQNKSSFCYILLFGKGNTNSNKSVCILNTTMKYNLSAERLHFLYLNKSNPCNSLRLQ